MIIIFYKMIDTEEGTEKQSYLNELCLYSVFFFPPDNKHQMF